MKVIKGNGCYTNYGNQAHVTRRLNALTVTTAVDKTTAKKLGPMHVTHAPQQTCPQECPFYPDQGATVSEPVQFRCDL
jgi:hypothetical protein